MDQNLRSLGLFVGILVVIGAAIFILSGGNLGGKKTVASDRDLPPVASLDRPNYAHHFCGVKRPAACSTISPSENKVSSSNGRPMS